MKISTTGVKKNESMKSSAVMLRITCKGKYFENRNIPCGKFNNCRRGLFSFKVFVRGLVFYNCQINCKQVNWQGTKKNRCCYSSNYYCLSHPIKVLLQVMANPEALQFHCFLEYYG